MINYSLIRTVLRYILITIIGMSASLMASAIFEIIIIYSRYGYENRIRDMSVWIIVSGVLGILIGILFNMIIQRRSISQRETKSITLALVRTTIIILSLIGIFVTIWYYYSVDYFRLRDAGPISLIVGLIFGLWDLLIRISSPITNRIEK